MAKRPARKYAPRAEKSVRKEPPRSYRDQEACGNCKHLYSPSFFRVDSLFCGFGKDIAEAKIEVTSVCDEWGHDDRMRIVGW